MAETSFRKIRETRKKTTDSLSKTSDKLKEAAADGAQFSKAINVKSDIDEVKSALNKEINERLSIVEKVVSSDKANVEKSVLAIEEEKKSTDKRTESNKEELSQAKTARAKDTRFGSAKNIVQALAGADKELTALSSEQAKDIAKGSNVKEQAMSQVLAAINSTRR